MTDEFQTRADIEELFRLIYSLEGGKDSSEEPSSSDSDDSQITGNYYTNEEIDALLANIFVNKCDDNFLYALEDYEDLSDDEYTLFRGDCWTVNNNYESSASITSVTDTDLTIEGTFRTENDLIGLYWNSKDEIQHPYISYGEVYDYTGVVLDFDFEMSQCWPWYWHTFTNAGVSITINKTDGSTYYLSTYRYATMGNPSHMHIEFDNLILTAGSMYIDADGNVVTVTVDTPLPPTDIKSIMFVIIPWDFNWESDGTSLTIMENVDFKVEVTNIQVTNGYIKNEHKALEPHGYRLCEGYDDFYNLNRNQYQFYIHNYL